jgi:dTMP kinase
MQKKAHLFVFEGVDGVGKTTLAHQTVTYLQANNLPCVYLSSPDSIEGTLGEHVYRLHHNELDVDAKNTEATSLQALHIAAHMDNVENHIKPALNAGTNIVLDRTWWSTLVYGRVYGANRRALDLLVEAEKAFWGELYPDIVFLVHRSEPVERELTDTWKELALEYHAVFEANQDSIPCYKIENAQSLESAMERITQQIILETGWELTGDYDQLKKKL